jgi:uncharacterized membrane protein (UPF0127 family)
MRRSLLSFAFLLAVALMLAGCGGSSTKLEDMDASVVTLPDGTKITADTMTQQVDLTRGMMFRPSLAQDRGMLFIHPRPARYQYWMYHCLIPLDIVWMDAGHRIVEISADTPPCRDENALNCPNYGGHQVALYVLELNAGAAAKHHLQLGDTIQF